MRPMLRLLLLGCLLLPLAAQKKTWSDEEVMAVHRSALLIDGHNDVTSRTVRGWDIASEAKGRRFESCRAYQPFQSLT
jgi:membrane dipeptidase